MVLLVSKIREKLTCRVVADSLLKKYTPSSPLEGMIPVHGRV